MQVDIEVILPIVIAAAGLIWLIIRLSTKPLEEVVKNNTEAMTRVFTILDRHETELKEHGEDIAVLQAKPPTRRRST